MAKIFFKEAQGREGREMVLRIIVGVRYWEDHFQPSQLLTGNYMTVKAAAQVHSFWIAVERLPQVACVEKKVVTHA